MYFKVEEVSDMSEDVEHDPSPDIISPPLKFLQGFGWYLIRILSLRISVKTVEDAVRGSDSHRPSL